MSRTEADSKLCGNGARGVGHRVERRDKWMMQQEEYEFGDTVEVFFDGDGWLRGKVVTVVPNYAFGGETRYSVHGEKERPYTTITSSMSMRRVPNQ